jgi:hypothetical protein
MARRPRGNGNKLHFETPTGKVEDITEHEAAEKYKKIRQGSLKGSMKTKQMIDFAKSHMPHGSVPEE